MAEADTLHYATIHVVIALFALFPYVAYLLFLGRGTWGGAPRSAAEEAGGDALA